MVRLTNGICIDVGWFPEHDPKGIYKLRVFQESPNCTIGQSLSPTNIDQLIQAAELLAWYYSQRVVAVANGRTNDVTVCVA